MLAHSFGHNYYIFTKYYRKNIILKKLLFSQLIAKKQSQDGLKPRALQCKTHLGGHSSVISSVPNILQPRVQIPSIPPKLFFNLYYCNCNVKGTKINQKRPGLAHFYNGRRIQIHLAVLELSTEKLLWTKHRWIKP